MLALKDPVSALDCGGITAGGGAALAGDCAAYCKAVAVCGGGAAASAISGAARSGAVTAAAVRGGSGAAALAS